MNHVYLVTSGQYSDYHIVAAYSTSEAANAMAEAIGADVEEIPLDREQAPPGMRSWRVSMKDDGTAVAYRAEDVPEDDFHGAGVYGLYFMWARDEQHAIKIANERRTAWLLSEASRGVERG